MKELLYGAAYYDEYMPYDRLDQDIELMKAAGMNVVRIGESTWSTYEPQPGKFDFSHLTRVLDKMQQADIHVIVGTPTYAVPAWLVKLDPNVIADTETGRPFYGARQIMDITNGTYLFYAERIIRRMMEVVRGYACVIGFQLDNETKYYGAAGDNIQKLFVNYLKEKFNNNLNAMNQAFGLDYWSNRIDAWEDFPDVRGTINGSLSAEFDRFRRSLVDHFLSWQAGIVSEYKREDQFLTQNFDFEWRGFSFGVQPFINQFHAVKALTIAGTDIYHPSQDRLTGAEIAFGGDLIRSLKQANYLVMETEAQGFTSWTPYKGQLRLQAYSHLANGANMVEYWHWHSIHNACETYWKGVLSHDLAPNETYREAAVVGNEWKKIGSHLVNLQKHNKIAILVSNEALTGLDLFRMDAAVAGDPGRAGYNDVVRWVYDTLFHMNLECDFISTDAADEQLCQYHMVVVPALYTASDALLNSLKQYVESGGELVATFKTAFADEQVKVHADLQPHILHEVIGAHYHEFTLPVNVGLKAGALALPSAEELESLPDVMKHQPDGSRIPESNNLLQAELFMELLIPDRGTTVLYSYEHPFWGEYAAAVEGRFGNGRAVYIGCKTSEPVLRVILRHAAEEAGIRIPALSWPVTMRKGINDYGRQVIYFLNYSGESRSFIYSLPDGVRLLSSEAAAPDVFRAVHTDDVLTLAPWGVEIIETEKPARNPQPARKH